MMKASSQLLKAFFLKGVFVSNVVVSDVVSVNITCRTLKELIRKGMITRTVLPVLATVLSQQQPLYFLTINVA